MRVFWLLGGLIATGIGIIGIFLPLVPTVPLILLAAFCFARSSERLHRWLVTHRVFGPMIRDWNEEGAISPRAKRMATLSVALVFGLSLAFGVSARVLAVQAVVLSAVLVFIWSRPNGSR